jgi:hypothetical protein
VEYPGVADEPVMHYKLELIVAGALLSAMLAFPRRGRDGRDWAGGG